MFARLGHAALAEALREEAMKRSLRDLAAFVVARSLARVHSSERSKFLREVINQAVAGIIVIEGSEAAAEFAFMLTESIVETAP